MVTLLPALAYRQGGVGAQEKGLQHTSTYSVLRSDAKSTHMLTAGFIGEVLEDFESMGGVAGQSTCKGKIQVAQEEEDKRDEGSTSSAEFPLSGSKLGQSDRSDAES